MRCVNALFCKDKKALKEIYQSSFPKNERMPFGFMLLLSCLPSTKFMAFYDGETLCGLIYMGKLLRQAFVMFFAVDEKLRSQGYGGRILAELKAKYPNCRIVVTIEPCREGVPELELRQRRKGFYLRNGYVDSGYDIKLSGIWQEILCCGKEFNRGSFSLFLVMYSCFAIIPIIRRRDIAAEPTPRK